MNKQQYICGYTIFNHSTKTKKRLFIAGLCVVIIICVFFLATSIYSIVQFVNNGKHWAYISAIADIIISLASIFISFISIWNTYKTNIKVSKKLNEIINSSRSLFPERISDSKKKSVFALNISYYFLLVFSLLGFIANSFIRLFCNNNEIFEFVGIILSWIAVLSTISLSVISIMDCRLSSYNSIVDIEEIGCQYNKLFTLYNTDIIYSKRQ